MKTIINVEDVLRNAEERRKFNSPKLLSDIEWHCNGKAVDIPSEEIDHFSLIGLNHTDFVTFRDWPQLIDKSGVKQ